MQNLAIAKADTNDLSQEEQDVHKVGQLTALALAAPITWRYLPGAVAGGGIAANRNGAIAVFTTTWLTGGLDWIHTKFTKSLMGEFREMQAYGNYDRDVGNCYRRFGLTRPGIHQVLGGPVP